jgi:hypothetical protein
MARQLLGSLPPGALPGSLPGQAGAPPPDLAAALAALNGGAPPSGAAPGAAAAPPPNVNEDGTPMTEEEAIQEAIRRSMQEQ